MGGVLLVGAVLLSVLAWAPLSNPYIWTVLIGLILLSLLGGMDDYKKLVLRNSVGVPARWKYLIQSLIALLICSRSRTAYPALICSTASA